MIDIHNHLLFGVDDGPQTLEETLSLLKEAEREGITDIILTPHFNEYGKFKLTSDKTNDVFNILKNKSTINLHLGNELQISNNLDQILLEKKVNTLANTKYVLIEFPFNHYEKEYDEYLYNISISGYKIIIAHPERYEFVKENIEFVERWIKEGYLLQINQNSLFNKETKKISLKLIDKGYVYFIASDAHGEHRKCTLKDAYSLIEKIYGNTLADRLFVKNPKCVLENKKIDKMPKYKKKLGLLKERILYV